MAFAQDGFGSETVGAVDLDQHGTPPFASSALGGDDLLGVGNLGTYRAEVRVNTMGMWAGSEIATHSEFQLVAPALTKFDDMPSASAALGGDDLLGVSGGHFRPELNAESMFQFADPPPEPTPPERDPLLAVVPRIPAGLGASGSPLVALLELDLDTGTERLSRQGVNVAGVGHYEAGVTSFGNTLRELSPTANDVRTGEARIELSNVENKWSILRGQQSFKNRIGRILLGDPEVGWSSFITVFTGTINDWEITPTGCSLSLVDPWADRLDREALIPLNQFTFPQLPNSTQTGVVPVPMGTFDSTDDAVKGVMPAYLVDPQFTGSKFLYVCAQGRLASAPTAVYRYGTLVDPADYELLIDDDETIFNTSGFSLEGEAFTVPLTYLVFDAEQRELDVDGEPTRPDEIEIRWDGEGITAPGIGFETTSPSNPVDQIHAFLTEIAGAGTFFDNDDMDLAFVTQARNLADENNVTSQMVIVGDIRMSIRDVLNRFAESFGISVGSSRTGKIQIYFPLDVADEPGYVDVITDADHIHEGSFRISPQTNLRSQIVVSWRRNWALEEFQSEQRFLNTDSVSRSLGTTENLNLWFVRDDAVAEWSANQRLFRQSENRNIVRCTIDALFYARLEVGDPLFVTHFAGIASDGAGFVQRLFQVFSIGFALDGRGSIGMSVRLLEIANLNLPSTSTAWGIGGGVGGADASLDPDLSGAVTLATPQLALDPLSSTAQ